METSATKQGSLELSGETTKFVPQPRTGGELYSVLAIQPAEFCELNNIPFCMASAIKHICLHKVTGEKQNLLRAIHYCEMGMTIYDDTHKAWEHCRNLDWVVTPERFCRANMFGWDAAHAFNFLCCVFTQGVQGYVLAKQTLEKMIKEEYA